MQEISREELKGKIDRKDNFKQVITLSKEAVIPWSINVTSPE